MSTKKYVSLSKLSAFLDNLKNTFATLKHEHKVSDITDYTVDSELSPTSTNSVQNKVLNDEFEAISDGMNALESAIDSKADTSALSNYYTKDETKEYADNAVSQKSQVQIITWEDDD